MQLSRFDIEDLAKARVNRNEKKNTDKWFWGMMVFVVAGFALGYAVNIWVGALVCIASVVAFLWYNSQLSKKQNVMRATMLKQWTEENKSSKAQ